MDDLNNNNNVNPYGEPQQNTYSEPPRDYGYQQNYNQNVNPNPYDPNQFQNQYPAGNQYNAYYSGYQPETIGGGKPGFAITSMIVGIVIFLLGCCWWVFAFEVSSLIFLLPIGLSVLALIFGIRTLARKYSGKGMAIAGVILCSVNLLFNLAGFGMTVFCELAWDAYGYPFHEFFMDYINDEITEEEYNRIIDDVLESYFD